MKKDFKSDDENEYLIMPATRDTRPAQILIRAKRFEYLTKNYKPEDSDCRWTMFHHPGHFIQSLKGAMMPGDYGLFVSLANYTKKAQKFLMANPIIRGINGTELVDLILKYYEELDEKYQKMIPLKMVYIPVPSED